MTEKQACPCCGEGKLTPKVAYPKHRFTRGWVITPLYFKECDHCGSELGDKETTAQNYIVFSDLREEYDRPYTSENFIMSEQTTMLPLGHFQKVLSEIKHTIFNYREMVRDRRPEDAKNYMRFTWEHFTELAEMIASNAALPRQIDDYIGFMSEGIERIDYGYLWETLDGAEAIVEPTLTSYTPQIRMGFLPNGQLVIVKMPSVGDPQEFPFFLYGKLVVGPRGLHRSIEPMSSLLYAEYGLVDFYEYLFETLKPILEMK